MSTIVWALGAWALVSIPVGLVIARGIARMNPPCEIADATDWDDIRTALVGMLARESAEQAARLPAPALSQAEADAVGQVLPAARQVA